MKLTVTEAVQCIGRYYKDDDHYYLPTHFEYDDILDEYKILAKRLSRKADHFYIESLIEFDYKPDELTEVDKGEYTAHYNNIVLSYSNVDKYIKENFKDYNSDDILFGDEKDDLYKNGAGIEYFVFDETSARMINLAKITGENHLIYLLKQNEIIDINSYSLTVSKLDCTKTYTSSGKTFLPAESYTINTNIYNQSAGEKFFSQYNVKFGISNDNKYNLSGVGLSFWIYNREKQIIISEETFEKYKSNILNISSVIKI